MLILARRQSPDWSALAQTYREDGYVTPGRYVPDHQIAGFPPNIEGLIQSWNDRFKIDFFTFRSIVAEISRESINSLADAEYIEYGDVDKLLRMKNDGFIYFYDDDDIFDPDIISVISSDLSRYDAIVTPLIYIGINSFTLVRGNASSKFLVGKRVDFNFRFQTNNYGINTCIIKNSDMYYALKDHIAASKYAMNYGFSEIVLDRPISATIKTPASASMMPHSCGEKIDSGSYFERFIDEQKHVLENLPPGNDWLGQPLGQIVRLCEAVKDNLGYDAIDEMRRLLPGRG